MSVAHCVLRKHRGSVTLFVKARVFVVVCRVVTTPEGEVMGDVSGGWY